MQLVHSPGCSERLHRWECLIRRKDLAGREGRTNLGIRRVEGSVPASVTDPNLSNPWGIGIGSTAWVSGEKSGREIVTTATSTEKSYQVKL
jgi:hypothetical protein